MSVDLDVVDDEDHVALESGSEESRATGRAAGGMSSDVIKRGFDFIGCESLFRDVIDVATFVVVPAKEPVNLPALLGWTRLQAVKRFAGSVKVSLGDCGPVVFLPENPKRAFPTKVETR